MLSESSVQNAARDAIEFVERLICHSSLTMEERIAILALPACNIPLTPNSELNLHQDSRNLVLFVSSGLIESFRQSADGKRQVTALHMAGSAINLHMLDNHFTQIGLRASCVSLVIGIERTSLLALAEQYPAISNAFWRDCALEAGIMMQWINLLGRKGARGKLAHFLCEMSVRYARGGPPLLSYYLPMRQHRLAECLSLTPVHLNRTIRELRLEGVATFVSERIEILDWRKLVRIAEFDPSYLLDYAISEVEDSATSRSAA